MVALAGALAEEVVLGTRSTGAAGDYTQALQMVEKIIASGMSSLGVVNVEKLSSSQREKVSGEILSQLEEKTREIIVEQKETLIKLVEVLQEEEVLSGDKFRGIITNDAA